LGNTVGTMLEILIRCPGKWAAGLTNMIWTILSKMMVQI
jgi:hypothetical protein